LVRGIGGERMGRTLDGCVESGLVVDAGLVASVHAALFPDALERRHLSLELLVVVLLLVKVAAAASRRLFVVVIFRTHEVLVDELLLLGVLLGGRGFTLGHGVSLRGGPFACGWVARGRVRRRSGALPAVGPTLSTVKIRILRYQVQPKTEKATTEATTPHTSPSYRHHVDPKRHAGTRYEPPDLRS
jgi:hypothetical protein